ncbi:MAG: proteasome assembly chaperone family protein [Thermoplasmata archaeon]
MTDSVGITDHKEMDLSTALVVVGFPGSGLVGSIATNFLVHAFKMDRIASILSREFPPMAVLEAGRVMSPARIHAAPMVCGVDGRCNQLAVVLSEVIPKAETLYDLSEALLSWCLEKRVVEMVVLEGFVRPKGASDTFVYGVGNSDSTLKRLTSLKVKPLGEGVLSGLPGLLTYLGETRGLDVTCLLAETSKEYPDARSAAKLLETLDPFVPQIKIDPEPLYKKAEVIEGNLKASLNRHKENIADIAERSKIMYG